MDAELSDLESKLSTLSSEQAAARVEYAYSQTAYNDLKKTYDDLITQVKTGCIVVATVGVMTCIFVGIEDFYHLPKKVADQIEAQVPDQVTTFIKTDRSVLPALVAKAQNDASAVESVKNHVEKDLLPVIQRAANNNQIFVFHFEYDGRQFQEWKPATTTPVVVHREFTDSSGKPVEFRDPPRVIFVPSQFFWRETADASNGFHNLLCTVEQSTTKDYAIKMFGSDIINLYAVSGEVLAIGIRKL